MGKILDSFIHWQFKNNFEMFSDLQKFDMKLILLAEYCQKFKAVKKTLNFRGLCTCRDKALPSSVKTIFKFTFIHNIRNPLQPSKICKIETQSLTFSFITSRGLLKGFTLKSLRDHFSHTSMQWANCVSDSAVHCQIQHQQVRSLICGHVTRWIWSQLWCTFYCSMFFFCPYRN